MGDSQERELRVLLERAVPQLPAPAQRLEGVRARIRRRRRRRLAAMTGGAVLAVAAGLVALPGLARPESGVTRAAPSTHARLGAKMTPPVPGPASSGVSYVTTGMGGLLLQPPEDWHTLPDKATTSVFLSTPNQPLALPKGGCAHALDGFCTPLVRGLGTGGVLVMFRLLPGKNLAGKARDYETQVTVEDTLTSCSSVGGTEQLDRTMVGQAGPVEIVWAVACMAHPSKALRNEVTGLLATASFS